MMSDDILKDDSDEDDSDDVSYHCHECDYKWASVYKVFWICLATTICVSIICGTIIKIFNAGE